MEIIYGIDKNDKSIQGIQVKLFQRGNNTPIEVKETLNDGTYKFDKKILSRDVKNGEYYTEFDYSMYSKIAKDLSNSKNGYWHKNENGEYDRYLYIPVEPNFNKKKGSKAFTETVLPTEDSEIMNLYKAKTGYRSK